MAARLRKSHQEDVKAKIGVQQIVKRLEQHISGEIELSTTQISAARILLDKTISNAPTDQAIEHSGAISFQWLK